MSIEQAVSPAQVARTEGACRSTKLTAPWRAVYLGLGRTSTTAWGLFALYLGTTSVGLFWPAKEGGVSSRTVVIVLLIAAQLSMALAHVMAQFRCASSAVSEGEQAARRSAWAGVAFVGVALLGGFIPSSAQIYSIYVAFLLIVISTFFWQVFLRALADRLELRDLRTRINRLAWWTVIAAACMLYRTTMVDRGPQIIGILSVVILLVSVAVYARLISATAAMVAERAPVE